ncbi:MAG: hypothetical protein ACR2NN_24855 [Bryobacteraceae bacterium]
MPIYLNGLNPITGDYLVPPLDDAQAAAAASGGKQPIPAVSRMHANLTRKTLGLPFPLQPEQISDAGWAIVTHAQEDPAVLQALEPLFQQRLKEIGNPATVKKLTYNGEAFVDWLAAQGVAPGTVKPDKVPFYLLIVGDPERIPFDFTQLLDIEYAVGRLHLNTPADYSIYAQNLVDYETSQAPSNTKEVIFFGTQHINDMATQLSCQSLVTPLADSLDGGKFGSRKLLGPAATKAGLLKILRRPQGQNPPAFLFSATHGLGWPSGDPNQDESQGALLCGEFKGVELSPLPLTPDTYFSAQDLDATANVKNLIAFHFACFGLGTPRSDKFTFNPPQPPAQLAPKAFFSPLPKRLLSHPSGPALAAIGHIERAWATSIQPPNAGPQIQPFQNAIAKILAGLPLGLALTDFSLVFGQFAALVGQMLADKLNDLPVDDEKLATAWTQQNDAEAYTLFGDPAIRLRPEKLQ